MNKIFRAVQVLARCCVCLGAGAIAFALIAAFMQKENAQELVPLGIVGIYSILAGLGALGIVKWLKGIANRPSVNYG